MPKSNSRTRNTRGDWGVMEMARERPIAAAAAAASAAAAGLFLRSKRNQISHQLSSLSDQIGEWTDRTSGTDDTAGLTASRANMRSGASSRSASGTPPAGTTGRISTSSRSRGMRKTGGGNAGLAAHTAAGTATTASGRGRTSDNS